MIGSPEGFPKEERLRPLCCPGSAHRFCLMVKKGYRDPPYHNWMHAFSVSHFCYLLYKNLELSNYLEYVAASPTSPVMRPCLCGRSFTWLPILSFLLCVWGGPHLPQVICSVTENDDLILPGLPHAKEEAAFRNLLTGWPLGISSSCLSSDGTQGGGPG